MVDTGLLDNNDNIVSACIVIACIDWVHCQYNYNNYDFRHVLTRDPETHPDKIAVTQACFYFFLCMCM